MWRSMTSTRHERENELCRAAYALAECFDVPIRYEPAFRVCGPAVTITMDLGGPNLKLCLTEAHAQRLAADFFDLAKDYPIPKKLIAAAFENAAAGVADRIEEFTGTSLLVTDVGETSLPAADSGTDALGFALDMGGQETFRFCASVDETAMTLLAKSCPPQKFYNWRIRYPLRAGSHVLAIRDYVALQPMDIVLLRRSPASGRLDAFVEISPDAHLVGQLEKDVFTVMELRKGGAMTEKLADASAEETQDNAAPDKPADDEADLVPEQTSEQLFSPSEFDALPMRLDFDLGHVDISLAKLRTLAPGYAFDLGAAPENAVTIRVSGREVGRGELVEIGGRLGVRINELVPAN